MAVLVFLMVCGVVGVALAQDDANRFKDMQPTGVAHRVALTAALRTKIELAYAAVLDVSELADPAEYLPENLDAKRAIRAAMVEAATKDAKQIVGDIEMIRLTKETCRVMNTVAEFQACRKVETMWVNRVRIGLGKAPIKVD
jgi:hypothetical protein